MSHPKTRRCSQTGLTLVELMVTVAVIAIIAAIATPSLTAFVERQRLLSAAHFVHEKLLIARTEAQKQSKPIHAAVHSGNGGAWAIGMGDTSACEPVDAPGQCTVSTNVNGTITAVPYVWPGSDHSTVNMTNGSFTIRFDPFPSSQTAQTITLTLNTRTAQVLISALGRVELVEP